MEKKNTELENEFFAAIKTGQLKEMKSLAGKHPELLQSYDYTCFGATPLTCVASKDDREIISALLELGADVNRCSDWDMGPWSPLHTAIHSGKMELAEYFLSHGAEMDVHTAAALGRLDDIESLLEVNPARVKEPGGDGCQPLHFAGTTAVAQLLLDRGADIDARCLDHYSTPVQYLATARPEIARYLFQQGATADIFSAIISGDQMTVKKLIQVDPKILQQRIDQTTFPPGPEHDVHNIMTFTVGHHSTPLHAATIGNQPKMIEMLIEAGSDVNVRGGYDDAAPLHQAAWQDNLEAAIALIENGADVNIRSGKIHNNSPAGWAIVAGSANVFCLLIDHGAETLDFFADDAHAAVAGEFRQYKMVPQENYIRIRDRMNS